MKGTSEGRGLGCPEEETAVLLANQGRRLGEAGAEGGISCMRRTGPGEVSEETHWEQISLPQPHPDTVSERLSKFLQATQLISVTADLRSSNDSSSERLLGPPVLFYCLPHPVLALSAVSFPTGGLAHEGRDPGLLPTLSSAPGTQ